MGTEGHRFESCHLDAMWRKRRYSFNDYAGVKISNLSSTFRKGYDERDHKKGYDELESSHKKGYDEPLKAVEFHV